MKFFSCFPAFLIPLLFLAACSTPPTPDQVNAWAEVGHTVVHGALQDAVDVHSSTKGWAK